MGTGISSNGRELVRYLGYMPTLLKEEDIDEIDGLKEFLKEY